MTSDSSRPPGPVVALLTSGPPPLGLVDLVGERVVAETGALFGILDLALPASGSSITDLLHTARSNGAGLALVDARALTSATVYGDLVADPRAVNAVLTLASTGAPCGIRVTGADLDLAEAVLSGPRPSGGADAASELTFAVSALLGSLAAALAARGEVRAVRAGDFPLVLVHGQGPAAVAEALAAVDSVDERALRLRRASRSDDGFLSTFLIRPMSRQLTSRVVRTRATPAAITAVSLVLGLAGAAAYAGGKLGWLVLGSVLLLGSLVIDCVDGEVARFTRTFSPRGGWLDIASDRVKEYAVYAGLAAGTGRVGQVPPWGVATAAMGVLVLRHFVDFGFAASGMGAAGGRVAALSEATSRRPAALWAKRAVIMPVGERTIALIVLSPLLGARETLLVLLALGIAAGGWTTAGRVGRALASRAPAERGSVAAQRILGQCDARPLPDALLPVAARAGWLTPALCRAVELAAIAGAATWAGAALLPGAYAVLAAAAFRDYDVTYRQRLTGAVRPTEPLAAVGWPVRVVLAAVLLLMARGGLGGGPVPLVLLALVVGVAAVAASARFWSRAA